MNPSPSSSHSYAAGDHFAVLGLERGYGIDRDQLERRYLELSQASHPDRYATGSPHEQRLAMERSTAINEAYRVLRDPVRRAEYLCKLGGIDIDSSDRGHGAPTMDQSFLTEMIERRECVDEAREAGDAELESIRQEVTVELESELDAAIEALVNNQTRRAARRLVIRRYLQRLLDEIEAVLAGEEPT